MLPDSETLKAIEKQWLKTPPSLCDLPQLLIVENKEKYSLKGKVKEVREYHDLVLNSVLFFSENGDMEYHFFLDEKQTLTHKYKLEKVDNFKSCLYSYRHGIYKEPYYEYVYNDKGLVVSMKSQNNTLHEYKYDSNNRIISIKSPDFSRKTFLYDSNNFLCEETRISKTTHPNYPIVKRLYKYSANPSGLIVKVKEFDLSTKLELYTKTFNRNVQGDIIELIGQSKDGLTSNKENYEYKYDKYNNWLSKESEHGLFIKREIDYYL